MAKDKASKKQKNQYLTLKEERQITADNKKKMKYYESLKNRSNVDESEYLTQMHDEDNVIEIDNLHTYFFTDAGTVKAVNGVSFDIPKGSVVGVVGESGCGKSVTSLSVMQLVAGPTGQVVDGEIRYKAGDGKTYNIAKMPRNEMLRIRGQEIAMIFQEPMTSLNPVFKIGNQLDEALELYRPDWNEEKVKARTIEMLELVGIADPLKIYDNFPHELSGGMRQRVMIAMALICDPKLIIADEPTTALDVTIQAQILDLLRDVKNKINGSIMLITHDLGVIAEMADYVVVMYAGKVIEAGTTHEIFYEPKHPYTVGLMRSKPSAATMGQRLYSIPGQVPSPINLPNNCYFCNRCNFSMDVCQREYPEDIRFSDSHHAACLLYDERFVGEGHEVPEPPITRTQTGDLYTRIIPHGRVPLDGEDPDLSLSKEGTEGADAALAQASEAPEHELDEKVKKETPDFSIDPGEEAMLPQDQFGTERFDQ